LFDSGASVIVSTGTLGWTVPVEMTGWQLTTVTAAVDTTGTTGSTNVNVRRRRASADATMLSTDCTIATGTQYGQNGVVLVANKSIATGDIIYIDVDATSSTSPKGLYVTTTFTP
jgi:hypothetical protein